MGSGWKSSLSPRTYPLPCPAPPPNPAHGLAGDKSANLSAARTASKSRRALTKFMSHWIDSYKRKCKVTVGHRQNGFGDAAWARPIWAIATCVQVEHESNH
jgi:hypothetical protein